MDPFTFILILSTILQVGTFVFALFQGGGGKSQDVVKDLTIPSTKLGTQLPVVFGKEIIPNVVILWYGDVNVVKMKVDANSKK